MGLAWVDQSRKDVFFQIYGPDGTLYAAWTEYEGALWLSRSSDGGESFSDPARIAGGQDEPARGPSLAVGPEGAVYLAWTVGEDPAADVQVAVSGDRGRSFGEPRIPFASEGHSDAPKVAVDSGGASFPALAPGDGGSVFVLWERHPAPGARPRGRGLGFTHSSDGGRSFTAPSVVPGSADPELGANGSQQGLLMQKLPADRSGALAVVNSTFREGEASHVWLFRARVTP